jgi:hypothetical protein
MKRGLFRFVLPAAALALASVLYVATSQAFPQVTIEMGTSGLTSLKSGGSEFLRNGQFRVNHVVFRKSSGERYEGNPNGVVTADMPARQVTTTYPWGEVKVAYTTFQNRLTLNVVTKNSSPDTIQGIWYEPLVVRFPSRLKEYDGSIPLLVHSVGYPAALRASYDTGVLVVADDEMEKPLLLGFPWATNKPDNTVFPLTMNTDRVSSYPDSYPVIERPIPPGGKDEYQISLRFGRAGDGLLELAKDVFQKYAQAFPPRLNWRDRRPIGAIFLATAATDWTTNPNGWLSDSRVNVTTTEGRAEFRKRMLALADGSIAILRDMNAQGAITWDIEGQKNAHSISYVGDPRLYSTLAPEMAEVADEYFKRFRDAGFRVGVCIRPQQFNFAAGQTPSQDPVADPAQLLIDKIRFAKDRWGATLIYLDSNVNAHDPNPLDASVLEKISKTFPDVLLIPEHSTFQYYAYAAPYKELRQGYTATPELVRAAYPSAFTFIATSDGPLDHDRKVLTSAVKRGDSVIYRTWYPDPQNEKVKMLYQP